MPKRLYQINEFCIVFTAENTGGYRDPPLRFWVIWYYSALIWIYSPKAGAFPKRAYQGGGPLN